MAERSRGLLCTDGLRSRGAPGSATVGTPHRRDCYGILTAVATASRRRQVFGCGITTSDAYHGATERSLPPCQGHVGAGSATTTFETERRLDVDWVRSGWGGPARLEAVEMVIARNPDPESRLPFLLRLPLAGGMVFRTSGTWPRTTALYCYPVSVQEWPDDPEVVEAVRVRSCVRRGAAIDLVLDRGRENRSQLVFTTARGRQAVFWQSPRTRKQARPNVSTPTARAAGIAGLEIVVDSHERYAYTFPTQQVTLTQRGLPCGDYGVVAGGRLVAAVERKSLVDLVASLTSGKLKFAVAELAALPRAAVVVEDRYSQVFKLERVRPAVVADGLAEVQVGWPNVPIVFCETRQLAQEWTYRFLAAAQAWAQTEPGAAGRLASQSAGQSAGQVVGQVVGQPVDVAVAGAGVAVELGAAPAAPEPSTAQVRAWARSVGLEVPDRGRLRPQIWDAWRTAHP